MIFPTKKKHFKEYTKEIKEQLLEIQKLQIVRLKSYDSQVLFLLNDKNVKELNLFEMNQIKNIQDSSIRNIVLKQEELTHTKEFLKSFDLSSYSMV